MAPFLKNYLLAALALGTTSCFNVVPDACNATLLTPVSQASGPKTGAVNRPAVFTLTYTPTSGCGTLGNLVEQGTGNVRTVSVNVNYADCSCAVPATAGQTTYTFQPTQAGTYYLRFVSSSSYLVDTLVVQ